MSNPATQFKKGQSGNLNGRPKKEWTMKGLIEDALDEADETGEPYKKLIVRKLRSLALKGDMVAIKEVNNRIDGMPKQDIEVEGEVMTLITLDTRKDNE